MKSIRLLPIVIFAAVALLLFKGIGLITNGGYVLVGATQVVAAGGGAPAGDHGGGSSTEPGGDVTISLPPEPTMEDTSPTLEDEAPTLGEQKGGHGTPSDHGAPAAEDHGTAEAPPAAEHGTEPAAEHAAAAPEHPAEPTDASHSTDTAALDQPVAEGGVPVVPNINCPVADPALAAAEGAHVDPNCPPTAPGADAQPFAQDAAGNLIPLTSGDGTPLTEKVLLERLTERRTELEAWEGELTMRLALVEAAEKRLEERTAALQALEAQIKAMVEEKAAMEEGQFKGLVGMYEQMKPGDAAAIFNSLDIDVLLRLARGISPRKMAPIMAKMDEARAQQLTALLADVESGPAAEAPAGDLAALPQIVGQ